MSNKSKRDAWPFSNQTETMCCMMELFKQPLQLTTLEKNNDAYYTKSEYMCVMHRQVMLLIIQRHSNSNDALH